MKFSMRINLLKWLIAPLLLINLIGAGLTYWLAWAPAQIAFDQGLADTVWALKSRLRETGGTISIDLPQQAEQVLRVDHFDLVYFAVRDSDGRTIIGDRDFPGLNFPSRLDDPIANDGMMRGESVRVISLRTKVGSETMYIGVAETERKRTRIRSEIFFVLILLEGMLTLISITIVWVAVTKGLLPLRKMQADLDSRNFSDLSPVPEQGIARELRPVVGAINGLLNRVQMDASARKDFLANVAHQLRTPLTGVKTQVEWLIQKHQKEEETIHSATLIMASTERMIRQTNQLLALARAEPGQFERARLEKLEMNKVVEDSIQHFVELAAKKNIDLGFHLEEATVVADRFLLRDLIDNLIDNAIRYTPEHGAVTVSCFRRAGQSILTVEDSGPGIAESERDLIFNRFYRLSDKVAGSGLGLSIVRDIAKDHNARISIEKGPHGKGTRFSVQFGAEAESAP